MEKGLESFCPLHKVRRRWSDRIKTVEEPLFKSYVFVKVTNDEQNKVRTTAGVMNFVYWLGKPAIIPSKEIDTIKRFLNKYENVQVESTQIKKDELMIIRQGIFMDKEAKVIKVEGNSVKVVIESLGYTLIASIEKKNLSSFIQ